MSEDHQRRIFERAKVEEEIAAALLESAVLHRRLAELGRTLATKQRVRRALQTLANEMETDLELRMDAFSAIPLGMREIPHAGREEYTGVTA